MSNIQITISNIQENFDQQTINRGLAYYTDKKVLEITIYNKTANTLFASEIIIFSRVRGSTIYEQKIVLPNGDGSEIEGECSCPVGYNCKHVAAVLFKVMKEQQSTPNVAREQKMLNREAQTWLNKFIETTKEANIHLKEEPQDEFLLYRLFEYRNYDNSDLEFYRAKRLKRGGISKGTLVSRENLFIDYEWRSYINDIDKKLLPYY